MGFQWDSKDISTGLAKRAALETCGPLCTAALASSSHGTCSPLQLANKNSVEVITSYYILFLERRNLRGLLFYENDFKVPWRLGRADILPARCEGPDGTVLGA